MVVEFKISFLARFVSKIPGCSFLLRYDIIFSAINLRTTTRDQFPLEIFVFGESIPVFDWIELFYSGFGGTQQIYLLLFEKFRL